MSTDILLIAVTRQINPTMQCCVLAHTPMPISCRFMRRCWLIYFFISLVFFFFQFCFVSVSWICICHCLIFAIKIQIKRYKHIKIHKSIDVDYKFFLKKFHLKSLFNSTFRIMCVFARIYVCVYVSQQMIEEINNNNITQKNS